MPRCASQWPLNREQICGQLKCHRHISKVTGFILRWLVTLMKVMKRMVGQKADYYGLRTEWREREREQVLSRNFR